MKNLPDHRPVTRQHKAIARFRSFNKLNKLSIARRDPAACVVYLDGLDEDIRQAVFELCDRYAAANK